MSGILYLAWRYLAYNRIKTIILVLSIMLIIFLPAGLKVLVGQSERELTTRAETTPFLIGAKGSPLELVLNSLYFESGVPAATHWAEVTRVAATGLAEVIPLYTRFRVRKHPIVGTSLDYFDFRGLRVAAGRNIGQLGECVLGADVAAGLGVGPGDHVTSSPETVFDLAGVYPLRMQVVGVLAPAHTPDDRAIFADIKTTWVIEGLGHGHQDMAAPESATGVLRRQGNKVVANASVVQYNEITKDNMDSFHFHGDDTAYPVSAIIAVPPDEKSSAMLQGRYLAADERVQIVETTSVMEELLSTILTVQSYVVTAVIIIGLSTLATVTLVFLLSLRLRQREILTMIKIGGARRTIAGVLASEVVIVLLLAMVLAAGLTAVTSYYGSAIIRALILS